MCLVIDVEKTREFKKKKEDQTFIFHKVFRAGVRFTLGQYLSSPYYDYRFPRAGIYAVDDTERVRTSLHVVLDNSNKMDVAIHGGCFHGLCGEVDIDSWKRITAAHVVVVPIKVHSKDVIAFGDFDEVCFKKFEITEEAWKDVFSGR